MRQLISDLFVSLDGYGAAERTGGYFDMFGPDLGRWIKEHLDEPQEILMGRRTYELLGEMAMSQPGTDRDSRRMNELPKIVLSHALKEPLPWTPVRVVGGDLLDVITALKQAVGPTLRTMGSISVVRDLMRAGLLDRLRLVVFPIVVGEDGREPIFADHARTTMELADSRVLDGRLLALEYVPPTDHPRAEPQR